MVTFGRTSKSKIAIPEDKFLSGIHFAVVWKGESGRLVDHGSSNGTYVNGKKVVEAVLKSGDEIRAGDCIFVLRRGVSSAATRTGAPPPAADEITNYPVPPGPSAPPPAARSGGAPPAAAPAASPAARSAVEFTLLDSQQSLLVGHWQFSHVPEGWETVEDYGLQEAGREGLTASAMASEEALPGAMTLDDFVQAQVGSLRGYFREPRIERCTVAPVAGAEDTVALDVRYKTKDGKAIFFRSVYVRRGEHAGILTLKTLESDLPRAKPVFDKILSSVSFREQDSRRS